MGLKPIRKREQGVAHGRNSKGIAVGTVTGGGGITKAMREPMGGGGERLKGRFGWITKVRHPTVRTKPVEDAST